MNDLKSPKSLQILHSPLLVPGARVERVLFAGPSAVTGPLASALDPRRYSAAARFESLAYLAEGVHACEPDAVVLALGPELREEQALRAGLAALQPTVFWTPCRDVRRVERAFVGGAAGYVMGELPALCINEVLLVARIRFERERELREELAQARRALAERKIIERAKGILMDRRGLSEEQAYHLMRRFAMNHGKRLVEVASAIAESPAVARAL